MFTISFCFIWYIIGNILMKNGGLRMSLVQAIVANDFILMGAETRGIKPDGSHIEGFHKMVRVNKQIIFGCTGGVDDNLKLFNGFCKYSETDGFLPLDESLDISYNEFISVISQRLDVMYQMKHRENNPIPFEIMSIVCGYNGNTFEASVLNVDSKGIIKVFPPKNDPYRGISAGKGIHMHMLDELGRRMYMLNGKVTLNNCKEILKVVFTKGAEIDCNINDDLHIELITKDDVMMNGHICNV